MKRVLALALTFALLLASFPFVGSVLADESAEHLCVYSGLIAFPGEIITITITDVSGSTVYSNTLDNSTGTSPVWTNEYLAYVPAVSGTLTISYTGPYGTGSYSLPVNWAGNGECFDDGRINSRPDRDLAAPVAIYFRTERANGYGAVEVYDINQVAGTGDLVISITFAELEDAWQQALDSGTSVIVGQYQDIVVYIVQDSDSDYAHVMVTAVEAREGKPYQYDFWVSFD